jgi:hypothetical protein
MLSSDWSNGARPRPPRSIASAQPDGLVAHALTAGDVSDSVAAEILRDLGAPPERVRRQVASMLDVETQRLRPRGQRRRLRLR